MCESVILSDQARRALIMVRTERDRWCLKIPTKWIAHSHGAHRQSHDIFTSRRIIRDVLETVRVSDSGLDQASTQPHELEKAEVCKVKMLNFTLKFVEVLIWTFWDSFSFTLLEDGIVKRYRNLPWKCKVERTVYQREFFNTVPDLARTYECIGIYIYI